MNTRCNIPMNAANTNTAAADDSKDPKDHTQDEAFASCINSIAAELCDQSKLPIDPVIADDGIIYERQTLESNANVGFYPSSQLKRVIEILIASGKLDEKYVEGRGKDILESNASEDDVKSKQTIDLATIKAKAEEGDTDSMVELGELYLNDEVMQRDTKTAYSWFALASEEEHEMATARKADCLLAGLGVKQDKDEGYQILVEASSEGSGKPYFHLLGFNNPTLIFTRSTAPLFC